MKNSNTIDISKVQIVVFDLDGTLADSKQSLTIEMGEALGKLLALLPVCVMSGGDFSQFEKQFLTHLPNEANLSNLFIFPASGSRCLSYKDNAWVEEYNYPFTKEEKEKVVRSILAVVDATGISKGEVHFGPQIEDRGGQITFSALGQQVPLEIKTGWDSDQKKRSILKEELEKLIPEFGVRIGGLTSIDITKKGISKATGIEWLEKRFGVHPKDMLYIGDALYPGGNDTAVEITGVQTKQVSGPEETKKIIEKFI